LELHKFTKVFPEVSLDERLSSSSAPFRDYILKGLRRTRQCHELHEGGQDLNPETIGENKENSMSNTHA